MQNQVVLVNNKHKTFFGNLYHDVVCRRVGACSCRKVKVRSAQGKVVTRKDPAGLHVFPKAESKALPGEVLHVPEVRAAVKGGWLSVKRQQPVIPEPAPKSEAPVSNGRSNKRRAVNA